MTRAMRGARVPTIYELALDAEKAGVLALRETAYPDQDYSSKSVQDEIVRMKQDEFFPVYSLNSARQYVVEFYSKSQGRPDPEKGGPAYYWVWSSSPSFSLNPQYRECPGNLECAGYGLADDVGAPGPYDRLLSSKGGTVRCLGHSSGDAPSLDRVDRIARAAKKAKQDSDRDRSASSRLRRK